VQRCRGAHDAASDHDEVGRPRRAVQVPHA
jgi:hypothetical protein